MGIIIVIAAIILLIAISCYYSSSNNQTDSEHKSKETPVFKQQHASQPDETPRMHLYTKPAYTLLKIINNSNIYTDNLDLSGAFGQAYDLMENSDYNLFITGRAGTGKSTLLQYFRERTKTPAVYLAFTGVAALNITGKTIHSFFQFPPRVLTPLELENVKYKPDKKILFNELRLIIIDEISMVRVDLLNGIDYMLRKYRCNEIPFGGVRMILIGDMYQLPPIVDGNDGNVQNVPVPSYISDTYKTEFFFSAPGFEEGGFRFFELQKSYRHKTDGHFLGILNAVRENCTTEEQLEELNKRCTEQQTGQITLCPRRADVVTINIAKMRELTTELFAFNAKKTGKFIDMVDKNYPAPDLLELKQGAQVMMVKNDKDKRWVNGTVGRIAEVSKNTYIEKIVVEINGIKWQVNKETWEAVDYIYDREKKHLLANSVGEFTQYPLMPAWAVTIHKSQGKTFRTMNLDMGAGAFAAGQTYVALSRCKTLEGISLKRAIKNSDIIPAKNEVLQFLDDMKGKSVF